MRERFEQIYATNEWHYGSGEGSLPANTVGYRRFLQGFLRNHAITTVTDYGCGDWQVSPEHTPSPQLEIGQLPPPEVAMHVLQASWQ